MKVLTCDKCGKPEAYYYANMRDPFSNDTRDKSCSIKRDLCIECAKGLANYLGVEQVNVVVSVNKNEGDLVTPMPR
jgi:hypothetical protein